MAVSFTRRFEELSEQSEKIAEAKKMHHSEIGISGYQVDDVEFLNWKVKARHLISLVCGEDSQHFKSFGNAEAGGWVTNHTVLQRLQAIFLAAKEDYEGGYLNKVRNLIQAEVFDNELEQAKELLNAGYIAAAGVIAGVVLETSLRQLCADNSVQTGKLDKMNSDLTKAGAYNSLQQKQITAWAAVRNSAAHGDTGAFKKDDVVAMIEGVERFLISQLT